MSAFVWHIQFRERKKLSVGFLPGPLGQIMPADGLWSQRRPPEEQQWPWRTVLTCGRAPRAKLSEPRIGAWITKDFILLRLLCLRVWYIYPYYKTSYLPAMYEIQRIESELINVNSLFCHAALPNLTFSHCALHNNQNCLILGLTIHILYTLYLKIKIKV